MFTGKPRDKDVAGTSTHVVPCDEGFRFDTFELLIGLPQGLVQLLLDDLIP